MTDWNTIPQGKRVIVWRKHYLNVHRKPGFRTICEVLREVYRAAEECGDTMTMAKMDEAADMAKRMQKRLEDYSGGLRPALIHFEHDYVWVNKRKLLHLSEDEVTLIEAGRARIVAAAAKAAAKAAKAAAKAEAAASAL